MARSYISRDRLLWDLDLQGEKSVDTGEPWRARMQGRNKGPVIRTQSRGGLAAGETGSQRDLLGCYWAAVKREAGSELGR